MSVIKDELHVRLESNDLNEKNKDIIIMIFTAMTDLMVENSVMTVTIQPIDLHAHRIIIILLLGDMRLALMDIITKIMSLFVHHEIVDDLLALDPLDHNEIHEEVVIL